MMGAILSPSLANMNSTHGRNRRSSADYHSSMRLNVHEATCRLSDALLNNEYRQLSPAASNNGLMVTSLHRSRNHHTEQRIGTNLQPTTTHGPRKGGLSNLTRKFKQVGLSSVERKRSTVKKGAVYHNDGDFFQISPGCPVKESPYHWKSKNETLRRLDTEPLGTGARMPSCQRESPLDLHEHTLNQLYPGDSFIHHGGTPYCRLHEDISQGRRDFHNLAVSVHPVTPSTEWASARCSENFGGAPVNLFNKHVHFEHKTRRHRRSTDLNKRHSDCAFRNGRSNGTRLAEQAPNFIVTDMCPSSNAAQVRTRNSLNPSINDICAHRRVSSIPLVLSPQDSTDQYLGDTANTYVPRLSIPSYNQCNKTSPVIRSCPYQLDHRRFSFAELYLDKTPSPQDTVECFQDKQVCLLASPMHPAKIPMKKFDEIRQDLLPAKERRLYKTLTKSLSCYALKFFHPNQHRSTQWIGSHSKPGRKFDTESITSCTNWKVSHSHKQNFVDDDDTDHATSIVWEQKPKSSSSTSSSTNNTKKSKQLDRRHTACVQAPRHQASRHRSYQDSPDSFPNLNMDSFFPIEKPNKTSPPSSYPHPSELCHAILNASTGELLRCLSFFVVARLQLLAVGSPDRPHLRMMQPSMIVGWIKSIDRALLVQGWSDLAFLNPPHIVFLFMMLKECIDGSIHTEHEVHTIVMACLYLAYSYMGNEISYPLKPFLVAETNQLLSKKDGVCRRYLDAENALLHGYDSSIRSKVIDQVRNRFWQYCLRIINAKSSEMLRVNADSRRFSALFTELKSYESLVLPLHASVSDKPLPK